MRDNYRNRPRIDLPPLMVNVRPSELADSTSIGRPPHGMTTRTMFVGWAARGQIQKLAAGRRKDRFDTLDIELPLASAIKWFRLEDEADLRKRMRRLKRGFGMLRHIPGDKVRMRPPVIHDFEIKGGKLWYCVERHHLFLPPGDWFYLRLADFEDAIGDRPRFREFLRSAAEVGKAELQRRSHGFHSHTRR